MATSGTTLFNPAISDIVEEAGERAGFEVRGGYQLRSAIRSLSFLLVEWANRGLNLWSIDSASITTTPSVGAYTMPADTVDLIEYVVQTPDGTVVTLERVGLGTWAKIAVPNASGRPIQTWIERLDAAPIVHLWPIPDQAYTFTYWRMRKLQDAGTSINTLDIPFRFIPAMTAGLAYHIAAKKMAPEPVIMRLKAAYDEAWEFAAGEDRDRSSFILVPMTDETWGN